MKVEFNSTKIAARLEGVIEKRQKLLDSEVLKDSNYFCPINAGTMQKSGILNTVLGSGVVQWKTPYVRYQYYLGEKVSPSQIKYSHNKNAQPKWFEAAKVRHLKKWEKIANGN